MIIFINGSINAGKSTVAKILAERIGNAALVEIDVLREMIGWMPIDRAVPINLKNALSAIKNFADEGLNIIVPYPLSQKNYDYLKKELTGIDSDIFFSRWRRNWPGY
ncbi:MAG: AAA family ATPase [Candidatus Nealsonbacteria bacterium DGGOD1a]|jgi:adenylate kinase family enzyme|nr:MAG: AAA family ATPase [Candidatus Nealsonbacteria bacterium DGGOD1a]